MWINDTKCKYMFMFPPKNLARKGLIPMREDMTTKTVCISYYIYLLLQAITVPPSRWLPREALFTQIWCCHLTMKAFYYLCDGQDSVAMHPYRITKIRSDMSDSRHFSLLFSAEYKILECEMRWVIYSIHKQLEADGCVLNTVATNALGAVSIRKTVLPGMAIPMLKIRRPNGRLIFNMEIAIRR